jgi:hypothetical protein
MTLLARHDVKKLYKKRFNKSVDGGKERVYYYFMNNTKTNLKSMKVSGHTYNVGDLYVTASSKVRGVILQIDEKKGLSNAFNVLLMTEGGKRWTTVESTK